jgi:iron(III) transport system permease protein
VRAWRLGIAVVLAALVAVPLAMPLRTVLADLAAWRAWGEAGRILGLVRNTAALVSATLALALPAGVLGAVLLYRTDLPLRRLLRLLVLLTLFVPLPLFTSGWQTVLGSGGWLPLRWWNAPRAVAFGPDSAVWTPWGQGIASAAWVHAVAGLPWVILIVGQGLLGVERALEEDASTRMPAWLVLLRVSLPRAGASVAAAALWLALQAAGEITVSDVMQVRTYAEEVYTQLVSPDVETGNEMADGKAGPGRDEPLARAVVVAMPGVFVLGALVLLLARHWERRLPPAPAEPAGPLVFPLGRLRWPLALAALAGSAALLAVPLLSLVWRAGLAGTPRAWSGPVVWEHLGLVARVERARLLGSLGVGLAAGAMCTALALVACWAALGARGFRTAVLVLMAAAWALPGPIAGLGLKDSITALLDATGSETLRRALWDGPSPAPLLWADLVRLFPFAVVLLWPVVRRLPPELQEAARVEGARPSQELRQVVFPLTAPACGRCLMAVAVLALGELSAGKLVSTPGGQSYAEYIFTQMHYGVTNDLAAGCMLLLALVAGGALPVALGWWDRTPRWSSPVAPSLRRKSQGPSASGTRRSL